MPKFTRTPLDTIRADNLVGDFMSWDEAAQGAECSEARRVQDIFTPMNARDAAIFSALSWGAWVDRDGYRYEAQP